MKRSLRIPFTGLLLAALTLACSFSVDPGTAAQPTVIFVPVTVTPGPTQEPPLPTNPESTATLAEPPTATTVPATATSDVLHFYVSGVVWHDVCKPYAAIPNPIPAGCLLEPNVGLVADGIYQAGEPGIAGVTVRIEIDCNYGAFTAVTDASGYYKMSFTVPASAGVSKQKICLSVDAASAENSAILLPGTWTSPSTAHSAAVIQITIPVEQPNTVNFGWDFQLQ